LTEQLYLSIFLQYLTQYMGGMKLDSDSPDPLYSKYQYY